MSSTVQSLESCQMGEQRKASNETSRGVLRACSKDFVERLVIAETLAQRAVQGTLTISLKAKEKRMGLYLDAGLLGVDFGEMTERRKRGQTEESIVEEYYDKLKRKRNGDDKKLRAAKEPAIKKQKVAAVNGHLQDADALRAVGAMMQLQREASLDRDTET
jgi:hypothetical protein